MKPSTSPAFVDDLVRNVEKRSAVSGNLLATTDLDGHSVTTPAVLLVEYPDKVRLELQDPVGGILALLVVNGSRCWLYVHNRPEIFMGPVDRLPLGLFPHMTSEDLARLFLARPSSEHLKHAVLSDGKATYHAGDLTESVLWEGGLSEPAEWQVARAGRGESSARYEDYEFKQGLHFPTKLKLSARDAAKNERSMTLVWKDWEPNVPKEKKLFQIPQTETFGRKIKALP